MTILSPLTDTPIPQEAGQRRSVQEGTGLTGILDGPGHHVAGAGKKVGSASLVVGGRLMTSPVRLDETTQAFVLAELRSSFDPADVWIEVSRHVESVEWRVLVDVRTSRSLCPAEVYRLSHLVYAAGRQAALLNRGITAALAVLVGQRIVAESEAATR